MKVQLPRIVRVVLLLLRLPMLVWLRMVVGGGVLLQLFRPLLVIHQLLGVQQLLRGRLLLLLPRVVGVVLRLLLLVLLLHVVLLMRLLLLLLLLQGGLLLGVQGGPVQMLLLFQLLLQEHLLLLLQVVLLLGVQPVLLLGRQVVWPALELLLLLHVVLRVLHLRAAHVCAAMPPHSVSTTRCVQPRRYLYFLET